MLHKYIGKVKWNDHHAQQHIQNTIVGKNAREEELIDVTQLVDVTV